MCLLNRVEDILDIFYERRLLVGDGVEGLFLLELRQRLCFVLLLEPLLCLCF